MWVIFTFSWSRSATSSLDLTRVTASLISKPWVPRASWTSAWRALLLSSASFPPLRRRAFPEAIASEATCGRQSGRDSKITMRLPIGTVTCSKKSPSATLTFLSTRPTSVSAESAIVFKPACKSWIFSGVIFNLLRSWGSSPEDLALARSVLLASMMYFSLSNNKAAKWRTMAPRSLFERAASWRPASRHFSATSSIGGPS